MLRRRLVEESAMFSHLPRAVLVYNEDYWELLKYFANQLLYEVESKRVSERDLERRLMQLFIEFFKPAKVDGVMFEVDEGEWEFVSIPSGIVRFVKQIWGSVKDFVDHVAFKGEIKLRFDVRDLTRVLVVHEVDEPKVLGPMANLLLSQVKKVEKKDFRDVSISVMWDLFKRIFYKFKEEAKVDGFMFVVEDGKWLFVDSAWSFMDVIDPWELIEYYAQK